MEDVEVVHKVVAFVWSMELGYSKLQERPEKSRRGIYQGVAKCRGSGVVGRGRGCG